MKQIIISKLELAQSEIQAIVSKVDNSISTWRKSQKNFKRENLINFPLSREPLDTTNSIFVFSGSGRFGKQQDLWLSDKGEFYFKIDNDNDNVLQLLWNAYPIIDKKISTKAVVRELLNYYEGGYVEINEKGGVNYGSCGR